MYISLYLFACLIMKGKFSLLPSPSTSPPPKTVDINVMIYIKNGELSVENKQEFMKQNRSHIFLFVAVANWDGKPGYSEISKETLKIGDLAKCVLPRSENLTECLILMISQERNVLSHQKCISAMSPVKRSCSKTQFTQLQKIPEILNDKL